MVAGSTAGVEVSFKKAGQIVALRMYATLAVPNGYTLTLRNSASPSTTIKATTPAITQPGWVIAPLSSPVTINTALTYIISYNTLQSYASSGVHFTENTSTSITPLHAWGANGSDQSMFSNAGDYVAQNFYSDVLFVPSSGSTAATQSADATLLLSRSFMSLPADVTDVVANQSGSGDDANAVVTFTPLIDPSIITYEYSMDNVLLGRTTNASFQVPSLEVGSSHTFSVVAVNAAGRSSAPAMSNVLTIV